MSKKPKEPIEEIIARALAIEKAGGMWTIIETAAMLRISLRTAQRNPRLRALYRRGVSNRIIIEPADVRALQARLNRRGMKWGPQ